MGNRDPFHVDLMAMNQEVTGTTNLGVIKFPNKETLRFAVDCGMFQEQEYEELNSVLPFNPENVDFCLVTHVHVDHTGRLPYMVKKALKSQFMQQKQHAN